MKAEDAALARRLVVEAKAAALSTLTTRDGIAFPFGSLVATAADSEGRPLLLLSSLAEHSKNLASCQRASLLFGDPHATDALASPRLTLLGEGRRVSDDDLANVRAVYLAKHPEATAWASFADFAFYRLELAEIRLVVGFGRMGWIALEDYAAQR